MTIVINLFFLATIAATSFSLIAQPASIKLDGDIGVIDRWFRVQTLRTVAAAIVAIVCVAALVVLNAPRP